MCKAVLIAGIVLVLLSPVLGSAYASFLLALFGGMESDRFYILIDGCICAVRIIGMIASLWGIAGGLREKS